MSNNKWKKALNRFMRREDIRRTEETEEEDNVEKSDCLLFVNGGLACHVSREELKTLFGEEFTPEEIILCPKKSYSLIRFSSEEVVKRVLEEYDNKWNSLLDRKLSLCPIPREVWDQVKEKTTKEVEEYRNLFLDLPEGLYVEEEFVSEEEEKELLFLCEKWFENCGNQLNGRKVKHFGFEFNYQRNQVLSQPIEDIPRELAFILRRLRESRVVSEEPDQLTINRYSSGQGIASHVDSADTCGQHVISLSLGSSAVMVFRRDTRHKHVLLARRSLAVMSRDSRYLWSHGISSSNSDVIISDNDREVTLKKRQEFRVSLTFRKHINKSHVTSNCGNSGHVIGSERELEEEFVHRVYDQISDGFSQTRHRMWPRVAHFLSSLAPFSLVLDVGCGNGKYMRARDDLLFVGVDRAWPLLEICRERHLEVASGDCLRLPVRSNTFDAILCIAVIHHLASRDRRLLALTECVRSCKVGGVLLVYCWAMEQTKDGEGSQYLKRDNGQEREEEVVSGLPVHVNGTQFRSAEVLVPFTTNSETSLRFYHVFKEGELLELLQHVAGTRVLDVYYDSGNWAAIVKRIS